MIFRLLHELKSYDSQSTAQWQSLFTNPDWLIGRQVQKFLSTH